ncbi:hypothetical protein LY76DRAFT_668618 [Colletotrichum caudatum]|nr:hypothetical protein LY76DRAFT_668618 [Colletotrichum caudatum]
MVPSFLVPLFGFAAAAAAAAVSVHPRMLNVDDVVLLSPDGNSRVMKAADYDALERAAAMAHAPASAPLSPRGATTSSSSSTSRITRRRRGCEQSSELQTLSETTFVDWDVPMSPVVQAVGDNKAVVSIAPGYSVSNSLKIRARLRVRLEGIIHRIGRDMAWGTTWTTTEENTYRYTMTGGLYGIIVSQPYVRRVEGVLLSGCTDSPDVDPFEYDSYSNHTYGHLQWVTGVIRLCVNETYPIPFCVGQGFHS